MENKTNTIIIVERKYKTKVERFTTGMKLVNTLLATIGLVSFISFIRNAVAEISVENITDDLNIKGEE